MRWLLVLLACQLAWAQSPAFEVASVKAQPWNEGGFVGITVRGNTLTAEHICLYGLVEFAYNLKSEHLSGGPSWTKCGVLAFSELYQVLAKTTGDPPPSMDRFRLMLQTLLADRFQLQVHHVEKDLPTYNLVVAPRGPKLKASAADARFDMRQDGRLNGGRSLRITATHISMAELIAQFEHFAKRPLFDRTGLSGFYDFEMEFDTDGPAVDGADADLVGQTFQTAIERQLGLTLEPGTASFDTVVIDRAVKPSAN